MSKDIEKKIINTSMWSITPRFTKCAYCENTATTTLKSWFGLNFTRPLCEKHRIEFILRRKELD